MVRAGAVLLILGGGALLGYLLYQLFRLLYVEPGAPLVIQVAAPLALAGLVLLALAVLGDRIRARRRERFEEVDN